VSPAPRASAKEKGFLVNSSGMHGVLPMRAECRAGQVSPTHPVNDRHFTLFDPKVFIEGAPNTRLAQKG
jgi:hypothetical protein